MSKKEKRPTKVCTRCTKERDADRNYYASNSENHSDSKYPVCKLCINKNLKHETKEELLSEEYIKKVQNTLLEMNRPFIRNIYLSSVEEAMKRKWSFFGVYIKNINLNDREKNWLDSDFGEEVFNEDTSEDASSNDESVEEEVEDEYGIELDRQNEKDVLRLLGYDPFKHEPKKDRQNLFNKLIDYLSEDVLEDGYKLSSVIELVKTFNQIDRINAEIATAKISNIGGLITIKEKLNKIAVAIAKENGIATGVSKKSGAGSGTFTGIMKTLGDYDFTEANANVFDIETSQGLRQVADISNKSIAEQLKFDENDYTDMLNEQRDLLKSYESKSKDLEEELRITKLELEESNKKNLSLLEEIEELKKN